MARKINVKLIMELRDAGLSRSAITFTRHISRHSVSEVFNIADEKGIRYDDVRVLEKPEAYHLFFWRRLLTRPYKEIMTMSMYIRN